MGVEEKEKRENCGHYIKSMKKSQLKILNLRPSGPLLHNLAERKMEDFYGDNAITSAHSEGLRVLYPLARKPSLTATHCSTVVCGMCFLPARRQ